MTRCVDLERQALHMVSELRNRHLEPVPAAAAALRVLQVTSEMYPLAKTGGLADVCGALPKSLAQIGVDVRVLMPAYPSVFENVTDVRLEADLGEVLGQSPVRLLHAMMRESGVPVWLLDCPVLYQRPGTPYLDPCGAEWPDNALRYGVLCRVASWLALGRTSVAWRPDIVHCHDWHTGLVPLLLRGVDGRPRCVFTVHNAAFQGNFPLRTAQLLGLPTEGPASASIEFYGQLSFLKSGLVFADKVTTVSPTYASELRTKEFGCGMDGVFKEKGAHFVGVMNGIDTDVWNPATDPFLAARYWAGDPSGKRACKAALQAELGLHRDTSAPIAIFASRLTTQKMADVLLDRLPHVMRRHPDLQFAMLGSGDRALEQGYASFAQTFPGRVSVDIGYRESLAHRLHAGADFLLHGSRFEPCGLVQLYAMRYGTIPIVRRVGGLADSVIDVDADVQTPGCSTGFVFDEPTGEALEDAVQRCLALYEKQDTWRSVRHRAMACDFGWARSAQEYLGLYAEIAARGVGDEIDPAKDHAAARRAYAWHARFKRMSRSGRTSDEDAASLDAVM